jgi:hypothetical protein
MDYKSEYETLLKEYEMLKGKRPSNDQEAEQAGREQYNRLKQKGKIRGTK